MVSYFDYLEQTDLPNQIAKLLLGKRMIDRSHRADNVVDGACLNASTSPAIQEYDVALRKTNFVVFSFGPDDLQAYRYEGLAPAG